MTNLETGDILFIDEIHRLQRTIEEYLYPAMEDFKLDIIIDQGPNARNVRLRAKDRRYDMGEISSKMADFTIVTSDNPRFEEPEDIIRDILVGVAKGPGKYVTVPDRREAIAYALAHAEAGDCIVIAGKGHEDYQEIRGVKYPMDDRQMILEEAARLGLCGK